MTRLDALKESVKLQSLLSDAARGDIDKDEMITALGIARELHQKLLELPED